MKILFVTVSALKELAGGLTSRLASARYRAIIPAEQLSRQGHEVHLRSVGECVWTREIVDFPCDVLVVSKSLVRANERLASEMKARGVRIVVDICDNVFPDARYGDHFRAMAILADVVTSNTDAMAAAIRRQAGRDSIVITDPVEGRRGVARFAPRLPAVNLLWFGNLRSLDGVKEHVDELSELCDVIPVRLTLVTAPLPEAKQFMGELGTLNPSRLTVGLVPWSLEATWRALDECDVVWIPTASGELHRTKSPNRLVESLWAGRLAAVDDIPSYVPFAGVVPVGKRLAEAIFGSLGDAALVEDRIAEAQRRIAWDHSAYACGLRWAAALGDESRHPLRLNLECGERILDGYVNIRGACSRAAARPDLVCDVRDLAHFSDGSADEILSVHAVEHFHEWEVTEVLREWVRALKPGGKMVVECANLLSACGTLLRNSDQDSRSAAAIRPVLQVLYGDGSPDNPLAARCWCYTPQSLGALLAQAGLVEVRQEPAQFGMNEHDMRIVGVKP